MDICTPQFFRYVSNDFGQRLLWNTLVQSILSMNFQKLVLSLIFLPFFINLVHHHRDIFLDKLSNSWAKSLKILIKSLCCWSFCFDFFSQLAAVLFVENWQAFCKVCFCLHLYILACLWQAWSPSLDIGARRTVQGRILLLTSYTLSNWFQILGMFISKWRNITKSKYVFYIEIYQVNNITFFCEIIYPSNF